MPTNQPPPPGPHTARRVLEAGVGFFLLLLVVRAIGVEAFSVPTGSMAPSILGNHRAAECPRCGTSVHVGVGDGSRRPAEARCPNCGQVGLPLDAARDAPGDRLLVDKNVFGWRSPRRWESAVFRRPDAPEKPFVKRVVGLPGESLELRDGDAYADGRLLRKTAAEARVLAVPVLDLDHTPRPDGWAARWVAEPEDGTTFAAGDTLVIDATGGPRLLTLRADDEVSFTDSLDYNGGLTHLRPTPIHDFFVSCEVEVRGGDGVLRLSLDDGGERVTAELLVGETAGDARLLDRRGRVLVAGPMAPLRRGAVRRVELAFVDRRATLSVDGAAVLPPADLPAPAGPRPGVARPLAIGAEGVRVNVRHLRLGRDVHYTAAGTHGVTSPCRLGPDEYFLLGDNSGHSEDSRFWPRPGVPESAFLGKPFLLHQPSRWRRAGTADLLGVDWPRVRGLH